MMGWLSSLSDGNPPTLGVCGAVTSGVWGRKSSAIQHQGSACQASGPLVAEDIVPLQRSLGRPEQPFSHQPVRPVLI